MIRFDSRTRRALLVVLLACHAISESFQDNVTSYSNENINISNQQETIKYGNTKTNNYNVQESYYLPVQRTKVVFNVGKLKQNKLRATRPPTVEELAIKKHIINVYRAALDEFVGQVGASSANLEHLGRILKALNPKYIATRRVMDVTFADPANANYEVNSPESEIAPPQDDTPRRCDQTPELFLRYDGQTSVQELLDTVGDKFGSQVSWDDSFQRELFLTPDNEFSAGQLAYKRLFQCLVQPDFCRQDAVTSESEPEPERLDPEDMFDDQLDEQEPELDQVQVLPQNVQLEDQPYPDDFVDFPGSTYDQSLRDPLLLDAQRQLWRAKAGKRALKRQNSYELAPSEYYGQNRLAQDYRAKVRAQHPPSRPPLKSSPLQVKPTIQRRVAPARPDASRTNKLNEGRRS